MPSFAPLENPASILDILSHVPMFGGITDAQQSEIISLLEIGSFKRGETIFQTGDEATHIYIVKSGLIGLFIADNAIKVEKKRLGKGELFGHVALMSINNHSISAVAVVDSEIIVLSEPVLRRLREQDSELFALLMMNIARELATRLQFTDTLLLKAMHPRERGREALEISGP